VRAEERHAEQREWLATQWDAVTTDVVVSTPSEWAERVRYLPPSNTSLPGFYRFDVTPYLREIADCFATENPIREVAVMKGVQVGATTGILENVVGYLIDEVKTAPVMLITADADLAQLRLTTNIIPMIQASGLSPLIRSSDEGNARKTGQTDKKIEWIGGGFLIPFGAQNANKLRSIPIRFLLRDETDAYPLVVGKDGDPIKLSTDRTAAYEQSRKILDISTPLIKGQSNIEKAFKRGDQRYYFVPCLGCGAHQVLRWKHKPRPDTGIVGGMTWETSPDGNVVPGSVRYLCEFCGHAHTNEDKTRLFDPANGAEWRATKVPAHPTIRSYHLSALYSPPGQQTWEALARKYLEAWDVENDRPRDMQELQVFYNNVLGESFELRGSKLKLEQVSPHRRHAYKFGEIPNRWALEHAGSRILLLTAAVDVHADNLKVAVWGWTKERRVFLVEYHTFNGDTEQLDNPETWGKLRELIEQRVYTSDDGKKYRIGLTLIDSGYLTDHVYRFCARYGGGVAAVKGQAVSASAKTAARLFVEFKPPLGERAFGISVDNYKDRWGVALKRGWNGIGLQPDGHFNAPIDVTDDQLKELTVETKVEKIDPRTKQRVGWEWRRPSGSRNELWDLLVYGSAALDMLAWDFCRKTLELDQVLWPMFWEACERGQAQTPAN
jgi:phage terminase large subunit GpA-like protein